MDPTRDHDRARQLVELHSAAALLAAELRGSDGAESRSCHGCRGGSGGGRVAAVAVPMVGECPFTESAGSHGVGECSW